MKNLKIIIIILLIIIICLLLYNNLQLRVINRVNQNTQNINEIVNYLKNQLQSSQRVIRDKNPSDSPILITLKDKTVYITDERIQHIKERHPGVDLTDINTTLRKPNLILKEIKDPNVRIYVKKFGRQALKVIIREEKGYIKYLGKMKAWFLKSAYFTKKYNAILP